MRKQDSRLLWGSLLCWLVFLGALTWSDTSQAAKPAGADVYVESVAAEFGLAGLVPVRWVSDRELRQRARAFGGRVQVFGRTECDVYREREAGYNYAACTVYLNRDTMKESERGGWRDTVRHEFCHVYAQSLALEGTRPDWTNEEIADWVNPRTSHQSDAFTRCARAKSVYLDGTEK